MIIKVILSFAVILLINILMLKKIFNEKSRESKRAKKVFAVFFAISFLLWMLTAIIYKFTLSYPFGILSLFML